MTSTQVNGLKHSADGDVNDSNAKHHLPITLNNEQQETMAQLKNEFFNDDCYDFQTRFGNERHSVLGNGPQQQVFEEIEELAGASQFYEDYVDENNDFKTGPLAHKHDDEDEEAGFYDGNEFDMNGLDEEQGDLLMMDTFFKRVDSQELVKPKKAKIISNYLIGEIMGDGSYGKVKECLDIRDLSRCAVKIINLKMVARKIPHGVENVRKEISIMKRLNHKNVIKLFDTFEKGGPISQYENIYNQNNNYNQMRHVAARLDDENEAEKPKMSELATNAAMITLDKPPKIYIFMDYCMTSLEKLLKNAPEQRIRNWQANFYFKQLIDGLEYLHSLNIIHNDIKPGNLLITCDNTLKICDFSISAQLKVFHEYEMLAAKTKAETSYNSDRNNNFGDENDNDRDVDADDEYRINPDLLTTNRSPTSRFPIIQCTPFFQCPEMLAENMDELLILKNAPKIDIWSSGITLYQLSTGVLPFEGQTIHQIYENIRLTNIHMPPESIDKNLGKLLHGMLDKDPSTRWSIKQIRESKWFRKKHPIVQEELAMLPYDVVYNETSTFRMLQFLQKLCQQQSDNCSSDSAMQQQSQVDPAVLETIKKNSHLINSKVELLEQQQQHSNYKVQYDAQQGNVVNNYSNSLPRSAPSPAKNDQVVASKDTSSRLFSQATKLKKTHCNMM